MSNAVFFAAYAAIIGLTIGFLVGLRVQRRVSRGQELRDMIEILEAVMVENDDQRAVRDRLTNAFRWLLDGRRRKDREGEKHA